jgi:hypothetical protein
MAQPSATPSAASAAISQKLTADSLLARIGLSGLSIDDAPKAKSMHALQSHDGPPPLRLWHKEPTELYPENEGHVRAFYTPNGFDHESVHKAYRGADYPKLPSRFQGRKAMVQLGSQVFGTLREKRKAAPAAAPEAKKARPESMEVDPQEAPAEEEEPVGDFIFVDFEVGSQYPAIVLRCRHNGKNIHFVIPALAMIKQAHKFGFQWFCQQSDKYDDMRTLPNCNAAAMGPLPPNKELEQEFGRGSLAMIRVQVDLGHALQWDGLNFSDISRLSDSVPAGSSGIEQFIVDAPVAEEFTVFYRYDPELLSPKAMLSVEKDRPGVTRERIALEHHHRAFKYFQAACHLTKTYGEYWYFRLAYAHDVKTSRATKGRETGDELWQRCIKEALGQDAMVLNYIPPPRWIVQAWYLCGPEGGEAVALEPKKWAAFPRQKFFGDRQSSLFAQRGFQDRQRLHVIRQAEELNEVLKGSNPMAEFHTVGDANLYLVEVHANLDANFRSIVEALPLNTQLTVIRTVNGVDKEFTGTVVEDVRTGPLLSLGLRGPAGMKTTSPIAIGLSASGSTVATSRCLNALNKFVAEQQRRTGAHLHSVLFGGPASFDQDHTWLTRQQIANWTKHIATRQQRLNESQRKAALAPTKSRNGVTLIHVSPGTGKTHVSGAIVVAALAAGLKVMVVGGTNHAADESMTKVIGQNCPDAAMVRFRSAFAKWSKPQNTEQATVTEADDDVDEVVKDIVTSVTMKGDSRHAEYGFDVQRERFIAAQVTARERKEQVACQAALELGPTQVALAAARKNPEAGDVSALRKKVRDLRDRITQDFLKHVNVVFVTCNSSTADELVQHYDFQLLICEEAGQQGVFEFATAIGAHREKIRGIVASGDHQQGSQDVNLTGQNEFEKAGAVSFMESMVKDSAQRYATCQLEMQYRMHPDVSLPNSHIWYPGRGGRGSGQGSRGGGHAPRKLNESWRRGRGKGA